ncbi:helix-turn-helix domain-containing protein [Streptomyces sp. NPDC000134]|uniref:helix-turn-helix domain-containing protein n=1 Tax=Streptomyces sp. NPDC000134 TaxID=3364536 RepID=UPI0036B86E11
MTPDRPVECVRLAAALRDLRAATGLSLAGLATKTPYSKSSWERYLNGKTLPPRAAVVELCELAGEHPARPVALWELADAAWSGRAAAPPDAPDDPPARPRRLRRGPLAGAAGVLAAAAIAVPVAVGGGSGDGTGRSGPTPSPTPSVQGCHGSTCTGKDPERYGCGAEPPPLTLSRHVFGGRTAIKIRYGTVCGAVWARIDLGEVGDRVEIVVPHRPPLHSEVHDEYDAQGSLSTPMVAAERRDLTGVTACLVRDGSRQCFGTDGTEGR